MNDCGMHAEGDSGETCVSVTARDRYPTELCVHDAYALGVCTHLALVLVYPTELCVHDA